MHVREMIATNPKLSANLKDALIRCIEECYGCAQTCSACADASLGEDMVKDMVQCIRLCLDCSDLCYTTGVILSRRGGGAEPVIRRTLEACAEGCARAGAECSRFADRMQHCRICAEACHSCEEACLTAMVAIGPQPSLHH